MNQESLHVHLNNNTHQDKKYIPVNEKKYDDQYG